MLVGALTGLLVGLVLLAVMAVRNGGRLKHLDAAIAISPDTARAFVDRATPPRTVAANAAAAAALRGRWASLARLGEAATIKAEMEALGGPEKHTDFAKNIGWLALTHMGPDPVDAALRLSALARESAAQRRHSRAGQRTLDMQAAIARAVAGIDPVPAKALRDSFGLTHADMGVVEALAKRCLARLSEREQIELSAPRLAA